MTSELQTLWNMPAAAYWLKVIWMLSAAAWSLLIILWGVQAYMAAQRVRWPALYIHLFKIFGVGVAVALFYLSLLWAETPTVITLGTLGRNVAGTLIALALFIEAAWRIKETAKTPVIRRARGAH